MIESTRTHYLERLKEALSSLASEGRSAYPEICLELSRPEVMRQIYRLHVVDIVERLPNGESTVLEINVAPMATPGTGLPIDAPIAWNGIEFRCYSASFPEEALSEWAERWITDESPPMGPQDGLTGIIHSITEPVLRDSDMEFSVDFGSAPIAAFEELTELLGSSLRSIGSYSLVAT